MQVQALADAIGRSRLLPGTEVAPNYVLPAAAARANAYDGYDAAGNSTLLGSSSTSIPASGVTQVVANVAALKAFTPSLLTNGQQIATDGYYASADGGQGVYLWDAASVATDNGGTVIQLAGGGTGRFVLLYRGSLSLRQFGAKGDGTTSDAVALQAWLNVSGDLFIPTGSFFIPLNTLLSVSSGTHISGPGKIIGPPVGIQAVPTAYLQINGSIGTGTAFGSTIAVGVKSFAVANTFVANDLLMLSNFPTDATDAFTSGGADIFGRAARSYANTSASNLRQTRRKELLEVLSGGNPFVTQSGTALAYPSTVALQFQKITPTADVRFDGVTFENVYLFSQYSRGLTFNRCYAYSCLIQVITCYATTLDFVEWDARDGNCFLDVLESSKGTTIRGTYRGLNCSSDNGMVKMDQLLDTNVDVTVEGVRISNAVMLDTNFGNNPTGYTDVPSLNALIRVVCRDTNGYSCVSLSNDPFASKLSYVQVHVVSDQAGALIKGCDHIDFFGSINYEDGSNFSINVLGSSDISLYGKWKGNVFQSTVTDPRTGSTQGNVLVSSISGPLLLAMQPAFSAYVNAAVTNVTGDGTLYTPIFNTVAFDQSGNYNITTGTFTAPVTGIYSFNVMLRATGLSAADTSGWVAVITSTRNYYKEVAWGASRDVGDGASDGFSILAEMAAGATATVQFKVAGSTKTVGLQGGTGAMESFFSGKLEA
jgi:hypothetical protein